MDDTAQGPVNVGPARNFELVPVIKAQCAPEINEVSTGRTFLLFHKPLDQALFDNVLYPMYRP